MNKTEKDLTSRKSQLEKKLSGAEGKLAIHLPEALELIREVLKYAEKARKLKTRKSIIKERAKDVKEDNNELKEYKKACEVTFEKEKYELRLLLLDTAMNALICGDQRSKTIPWAYYGFRSKKLTCSYAAFNLLGIEKKERLGIKYLLDCIRKEDQEGIEKSLREGTGLRHYSAWTSRKVKNRRKLALSTFPFYYRDSPVGVAIFLRDPEVSKYSRRIRCFENTVEAVAEMAVEQILKLNDNE